jgi:hypothetical protein
MQRYLHLSVIFTFLFCLRGKAQEAEKDSTDEAGSSLEVTMDYTGDSGFFGIYNNLVKQPTLGSSVAFYGRKGLFLYANGYYIGNSNRTLSKSTGELDVIGGWNFYLSDDAITLSPSYGHFFYSSGSSTAKSFYANEFGLGINGTFNWFRPSVTADYFFGKNQALNINLMAAFHLEVENLFAQGNTLVFEPTTGTNWGDNSFYYRLSNLNFSSLKSFRAKYGDNITIKELIVIGTIAKNKQTDRELAALSTTATLGQIFSYTPSYQINSVDLIFPVHYAVRNLTLNAAFSVSFPLNIPDFLVSKTHIYFSAGISYSFDL